MLKFIIQIFLLSCLVYVSSYAQTLESMHTRYDDSFREWVMLTIDEQEISLEPKWSLRNDWTEWNYDINGDYGEIRQKWNNDWNSWEVRGGNEIYNIRTVWKNDFGTWRIIGEGLRCTISSKYANVANDWELEDDIDGVFNVFYEYRGDPRDWLIDDFLDEEISIHARIAMAFIAIINSIPQY